MPLIRSRFVRRSSFLGAFSAERFLQFSEGSQTRPGLQICRRYAASRSATKGEPWDQRSPLSSFIKLMEVHQRSDGSPCRRLTGPNRLSRLLPFTSRSFLARALGALDLHLMGIDDGIN